MITLKFPSLEKALMKADKDWKDDDARKGIIVLNNNAIVLADTFCFVIDLFEYFTVECGIDEPEDLKELERILFFMNYKIFNSEFWKEITKGANMSMQEGLLFIENPKYSKDLYYKETEVDFLEPLLNIQKSFLQAENVVSSIGLPFNALKSIYDVLPQDFKNDVIILEFSAQDRLVKYTFRKRKHCYGYITPHYDSVQEGFRFDILENFITAEDIVGLIEELKEKVVPPPPPIPPDHSSAVEEVENEPNLFDDGKDD